MTRGPPHLPPHRHASTTSHPSSSSATARRRRRAAGAGLLLDIAARRAGLQEFYDTHGDHWRGELHDGRLGRRTAPGDEPLRTRARLVARIVTTGLVLRQDLAITVGRPDLAEPVGPSAGFQTKTTLSS
ncbi:hypothetical protein Sya03_57000 [Spirilliplanes yamanashiensis]|uniref:Uncharacterized protein n=1 Tax=Spirilliplanes yamanashiensis TaxID=42233 RepID=A0A8J3YD29_9ACTN|nr:hypothetical protein Sya03_57000 [Spirilliplanes yamanashiensis]